MLGRSWLLPMVVRALTPRTLVTFDVDGTLVKGSGQSSDASVHARAFAFAVGKVLGTGSATALPRDALPRELYHGSTDGLIALRLARAELGVEPPAALAALPEIFTQMVAYTRVFNDTTFVRGIEPLPQVLDTLRSLAVRPDVVCGLVTGNVEAIAHRKMSATGILATGALAPPAADQTGGFLGGFGSDYCSGDIDDVRRNYLDRGEQLAIAWRRARARYDTLNRLVHVGDAPADVLAAKACATDLPGLEDSRLRTVGCIAVATGSYTPDVLADLAGPPLSGPPRRWEPAVLAAGIADPSFLDLV